MGGREESHSAHLYLQKVVQLLLDDSSGLEQLRRKREGERERERERGRERERVNFLPQSHAPH